MEHGKEDYITDQENKRKSRPNSKYKSIIQSKIISKKRKDHGSWVVNSRGNDDFIPKRPYNSPGM